MGETEYVEWWRSKPEEEDTQWETDCSCESRGREFDRNEEENAGSECRRELFE